MKLFRKLLPLGILLFFIYYSFSFVSNKAGIASHCREVRSFIQTNQGKLETILTETFDRAVACRSEECNDREITQVLGSLKETDEFRFFGTSYFIRLNDDANIEKWFWAGHVTTTIPTTKGEKQVVKVLQGNAQPICTQNWKLDAGSTYMTYLKDGYSEAETVIPVKKGDQVIGAIVSRFGD